MKDCKCDECCSEYVPINKRPKYELCVDKGTCDTKRGICNSKNKTNSKEGFSIKSNTPIIIGFSIFICCVFLMFCLFIYNIEGKKLKFI